MGIKSKLDLLTFKKTDRLIKDVHFFFLFLPLLFLRNPRCVVAAYLFTNYLLGTTDECRRWKFLISYLVTNEGNPIYTFA
jgi:hypothetical protein